MSLKEIPGVAQGLYNSGRSGAVGGDAGILGCNSCRTSTEGTWLCRCKAALSVSVDIAYVGAAELKMQWLCGKYAW